MTLRIDYLENKAHFSSGERVRRREKEEEEKEEEDEQKERAEFQFGDLSPSMNSVFRLIVASIHSFHNFKL